MPIKANNILHNKLCLLFRNYLEKFMRKKRKVLSLWLTLVFVVLGLFGVAGVAVLALYITGGFNQEIIEPQNMSYNKEIGRAHV